MKTKQKHTRGVSLIALLMLFTGIFASHGKLFGKTSTPPPMPVEEVKLTRTVNGRMVVDRAFYESVRTNPQRLQPLPAEYLDAETLWLARCIYSETKRTEEMELVAWVVRNRVETGYRGKRTYHSVVLDPYQFSAFNPGSRKRNFYTSLTPESQTPGWLRALHIAHYVRHANPNERPFSIKTRHFYSERSMVGRRHPSWARGLQPVALDARDYEIDARRFRFYAGIY